MFKHDTQVTRARHLPKQKLDTMFKQLKAYYVNYDLPKQKLDTMFKLKRP